MKSMLKLFCIALISAGFILSGCERQEPATDEEPTAEQPEEAGDTEEPAAEEDTGAEEEEQADTGAEEEEEADADEEDAEEQGAAAEQQQQQQQQAQPQRPPVTGAISGTVGGSGITNGQLKVTVNPDYSASGSFSGRREDARFRIPLKGSVNKQNNSISLSGERDGNTAQLNGNVTNSGVAGSLSGNIHQRDFESRFNINK